MTRASRQNGGPSVAGESSHWSRPRLGVASFILLYTLGSLILFQGPLFARALTLLDATSLHGVLTLGSMVVILVFLKVVTLSLISFVSLRLLKLVCMAILPVNALAFYFMQTYGTLIDIIIIRNVFATNTKTTLDLFHPGIIVYVLLMGVLPALAIARVQLRRSAWRWRIGLLAGTVVASFSYAYATSYNWLWFDRHMPVLGSLALPWNYLVNTVTYFRAEAAVTREQVLLPPARAVLEPPPGQRLVVVLVLGEAARSANHAEYGYPRETNPFTRDRGVVALPNARSCGTYTLIGLACMMTHVGSAATTTTRFEPLPSYLHRHGVDVDWRTNSSGEPRVTADSYVTLAQLRAECEGEHCARLQHEEGLLEGLAERIAGSEAERMFIVIHQGNGSHGPAYSTQYPPEFARFLPVCETVQIQHCSQEELVNAYDNTIVYTDYILGRVIDLLEGLPDTVSTMMFVSDHGQSLGEHGVYLHGLPNAIAPDYQRDIPFLVWMSEGFMRWRGIDRDSLAAGESHGHDHVFHSVMGAFGLTSEIYRPEFDIFDRRARWQPS